MKLKMLLLISLLALSLAAISLLTSSYITPSNTTYTQEYYKTQENISSKNIVFYIYGSIGCPACKSVKELLEENFGKEIVFYELSGNEEHVKNFHRIYELLAQAKGMSLNLYIPLTGVFMNDRLAFIVIGYHPLDFWEKILSSSPKDYIVVFYPGDGDTATIVVADNEIIQSLEKLFAKEG